MRWKMQNQTAWMENAGLENAGNDIVWNGVWSKRRQAVTTTLEIRN